MKITIESTDQIVQIYKGGVEVPARLWVGKTESGIEVQVLVTRIAAHGDADLAQFDKELKEQQPPRSLMAEAFPLRLIL